ncbi:VWA domain-containing protein (plasmid) [Deinococcus taeanensis]|uniref:vWA domain-containing protein n=1 Tax=Deinococcus taeanensis TaxID=2737050 RepID=UPI001CDBCD34|nr:VWA domain-containing protein [Deinococcus taeanensis]UBV44675.1 VWA domain-containing protein [Deinococcus taeanensis]
MKAATKTLSRVLLSGLLLGCAPAAREQTLDVLAGSELSDLEGPVLDAIARNTGVRLKLRSTGTIDAAERIAAGQGADLAWLSSDRYLQLHPGAARRILARTPTMLSPVVLGVRQDLARQWGWEKGVSWKDVAVKAGNGEFSYAMTNPAASNSGFSALVGVTSALAGGGDAVALEKLDTPEVRGFARGVALSAGSSGFLADAYVRDQDTLGGMINYESVITQLNASGRLRTPLTVLMPEEGVVTADYPLMLLNPDARAAYGRVTAYLKTPQAQALVRERTGRRTPGGQTDAPPELAFPGSLGAIDATLRAYLDENRRPASTTFVLDISGSMRGERLAALKRALQALAGGDVSVTGRYARFAPREQVRLITFADRVHDLKTFEVGPSGNEGAALRQIHDYAGRLELQGGTAIYAALNEALRHLKAEGPQPERIRTVVLMTDGENNEGPELEAFLAQYATQPAHVRAARIFPILFGEARPDEMAQVARVSGGRVFDARSTPLPIIFKDIRAYQ